MSANSPLIPPFFSLVLATYGRCDELRPMLKTLLEQQDASFELVVVDQNNDDRIKPLLEPLLEAGIPVQHLRLDRPNLSHARNMGIEHAKGMFVAFPDDDCWYEPDCLKKISDYINKRPELCGVVASWVEVEHGRERKAHDLSARAWRRFNGGDASSITLFFRRNILQKHRGFDARFGVGQYYGAGEETDLLLRLLSDGAVIAYHPDAQVHHAFSNTPPPLTAASFKALLKRERGPGAMYIKHKLPLWVILRGLVAPMIKSPMSKRPIAGLGLSLAMAIGRIQGMLSWYRHESGQNLEQAIPSKTNPN